MQETHKTPAAQATPSWACRLAVPALLVIAAGLLALAYAPPFDFSLLNWQSQGNALTAFFQTGGTRANLGFVALSAVLIMVGTPRLLFFGLGGFVFGFWEGLLWSLCGSLLGSFIAFRGARWAGRGWLAARFGQHRHFGQVINAQPGVASVTLIRLLPISNVIINIGLAVSSVGSRAFLVGSLIGFLPQGILGVLVGSGLTDESALSGSAPIGIAALLLLAALFKLTKRRQDKTASVAE